MKVFITTMHDAHNYGAALQAVSLQNTIQNMGHTVTFIETKSYRYPKLVFPKRILRLPFYLGNFFSLYKSDKRFNDFKNTYMCTTPTYENYAALEQADLDADVFLSGSDQVWNPLSSNPKHFFCYVPDDKKKISYAASLGISYIPDDKIEFFKENINRFTHISVREDNAKTVLSEITEKPIDTNIDPVFLQTAEQWKTLASAKPKFKKPYILVYVLYRAPWLNRALKKLRQETGMDIVLISDSSFRFIYRTKAIYSAGPQEFLRLFADASAVVTSSFHGTAFSLLFKKPFYAVVNPKAPSRITSLLEKFDMGSAVIHSEEEFKLHFHTYPVNFDQTAEKEREAAMAYLRQAIEK